MDGILIADKPAGITSFGVVREVKALLGARKVGHGGTLDPLATGVLPLFINRATKLVPFLMNGTKKYRATMKLGIATDSQDRDGRVVAESNDIPTDHEHIIRVLSSFTGMGTQIPPMFSALKVRGTPLYKFARKGISLERKPRSIFIHGLRVVDISLPRVTFEVTCSAGTYIRTLCADSGTQLGCGAHLVELTRLQSGLFHLEDAMKLDQLRTTTPDTVSCNTLLSLSKSFKNLPSLILENNLFALLKKRKTVSVSQIKSFSPTTLNRGDLVKVSSPRDTHIALVHSLIDSHQLCKAPETNQALKLVCFFNPYENTLH
jgi:tRNA pseudouridine55 synthase